MNVVVTSVTVTCWGPMIRLESGWGLTGHLAQAAGAFIPSLDGTGSLVPALLRELASQAQRVFNDAAEHGEVSIEEAGQRYTALTSHLTEVVKRGREATEAELVALVLGARPWAK